ncbi:hypothetical protein ACIQWR_39895 [Streptomyces sp. NPDC098789]|uniref:hypothetical protein n=1 Tax=Streptomyces sp. NPDC098789 TaxID=3366098 RepID=UPI0037F89B32
MMHLQGHVRILGEGGAASIKTGTGDPTQGLKMLPYAKDTTKIGTENLRGLNTVHSTATIPQDKLGAAGSPYKHMGMPGDITMDVWIDDKGTPARMSQAIGETTMDIDFLKFGASRTVVAPPTADTADMTEQFKKMKRGEAA